MNETPCVCEDILICIFMAIFLVHFRAGSFPLALVVYWLSSLFWKAPVHSAERGHREAFKAITVLGTHVGSGGNCSQAPWCLPVWG